MFSATRETTVVSQAREVLDVRGVRPAVADPGVLDRVVRVAERAEHAVGHGAQVGPVLLEALGLPVPVIHRSPSSRVSFHTQGTPGAAGT